MIKAALDEGDKSHSFSHMRRILEAALNASHLPKEDNKKLRVVVCAAIRINKQFIICGARHWDSTMGIIACKMPIDIVEEEQGFIDQFGVFMTREEAYEVAKAAGQIRYRCGGNNGRLFSENLY